MNIQTARRGEKRVEKLQIMVADSELALIDNWRFENRHPNRSAAVRALIFLGMEFAKSRPDDAAAVLKSLR